MRMTVYGNNATCPEADGACSCFLIEADGGRILLDMGNGSLAKLQKDVDLAALDLIVISHLHFDHFGDLFCAKYQLESRRACGEAIPRIPLLTPRLPAWARAEPCTNDVFEPHVIEDGLRFRMGDAALEFIGTVHLVESYGVRLEAEGRTLAYSRAMRARVRSLRASPQARTCFCARRR
ncbi:MAG: MBL fold metallo-hydrolase [Ruthenibacterium lactatiformans]